MLSALEVITTVIVGLMVGVEFSVAFVMNPIFNALPEDSNQQAHSHGGRMLGALMPFWYIGSLVLAAVWAVAGWHHHGTGASTSHCTAQTPACTTSRQYTRPAPAAPRSALMNRQRFHNIVSNTSHRSMNARIRKINQPGRAEVTPNQDERCRTPDNPDPPRPDGRKQTNYSEPANTGVGDAYPSPTHPPASIPRLTVHPAVAPVPKSRPSSICRLQLLVRPPNSTSR
ncbi:hypothetical protein GCM10018966_016800 [Streptomyces yanii]